MAKRITASDLDIYYGDFLAVEGVAFEVEPGSITAFIGLRVRQVHGPSFAEPNARGDPGRPRVGQGDA